MKTLLSILLLATGITAADAAYPRCEIPTKQVIASERVAQRGRPPVGGQRYCAPGAHVWAQVGTAPGTGRPILRCSRCGLTKIQ